MFNTKNRPLFDLIELTTADKAPMIQFIEITAQYSNAVLVAILPFVSEFAQKLELPVPLPITTNHVLRFTCDQRMGQIGGAVRLTNGYVIRFDHGVIDSFHAPDCYYVLQEVERIPEFFGPLNLNKKQAVQMARDAVKRLGYSEKTLRMDRSPKVDGPTRLGKNIVPRYLVRWDDDETFQVVEIEIDAAKKRVASMFLASRALWRAPPKVDVIPKPLPPGQFPAPLRFLEGQGANAPGGPPATNSIPRQPSPPPLKTLEPKRR